MHGTRTSGQKMRAAFYRLHAATLNPATTPDVLAQRLRDADAVTERHRLAEGAVYASACRRYLLDTGRSWKGEQVTADATTWGESSHRSRLTPTGWRCSCGAAGTSPDPAAAHAEHVSAVA